MKSIDLILFCQIADYRAYILINSKAGTIPCGDGATFNDVLSFPVSPDGQGTDVHYPTVYSDFTVNMPRTPAIIIAEENLPRSIRRRYEEFQAQRQQRR